MRFNFSPKRHASLCSVFAAALMILCLRSSVQAAQVLYATGTGSPQLSALYTIDTATGAATLVQQFPGIHIYGGGLAYDAATDTLYATGVLDSDTGTSRLFIINRFTGAFTYFPGMSPTINISFGGLAISPVTGVMYATGGSGNQSSALFTINKNTGAETFVGLSGGQCCTAPFGFNMNGLGFSSDGTLFANGFTLDNGDSHLYTLNLASGLAADVGSHGVNLGRSLKHSGLAFNTNGTMYSLGSTSASAQGLYSVNPATGAATVIGDTVLRFGVDGGLAFAPDQPVPQRASLSIALTSTNTLLLSWPTNIVNSFPYVLHESASLNPANWLIVTNAPTYASGTNGVILPRPITNRFYRLQTP